MLVSAQQKSPAAIYLCCCICWFVSLVVSTFMHSHQLQPRLWLLCPVWIYIICGLAPSPGPSTAYQTWVSCIVMILYSSESQESPHTRVPPFFVVSFPIGLHRALSELLSYVGLISYSVLYSGTVVYMLSLTLPIHSTSNALYFSGILTLIHHVLVKCFLMVGCLFFFFVLLFHLLMLCCIELLLMSHSFVLLSFRVKSRNHCQDQCLSAEALYSIFFRALILVSAYIQLFLILDEFVSIFGCSGLSCAIFFSKVYSGRPLSSYSLGASHFSGFYCSYGLPESAWASAVAAMAYVIEGMELVACSINLLTVSHAGRWFQNHGPPRHCISSF